MGGVIAQPSACFSYIYITGWSSADIITSVSVKRFSRERTTKQADTDQHGFRCRYPLGINNGHIMPDCLPSDHIPSSSSLTPFKAQHLALSKDRHHGQLSFRQALYSDRFKAGVIYLSASSVSIIYLGGGHQLRQIIAIFVNCLPLVVMVSHPVGLISPLAPRFESIE